MIFATFLAFETKTQEILGLGDFLYHHLGQLIGVSAIPPIPSPFPYTLLENLTDDAIAKLYVTKFSTISLYLTKLYVT